MKVILKEDIKKIGSMGQTVTVADGFARNYLVPKGLAVQANIKNMKSLEHAKKVIQEKAKKMKASVQDFADRLSKITLVIKAKAGEEGKLFGSVTTMDIAEQLKNEGIEIDKKKISLDEPIKRIGTYAVSVRLHPEIDTQINLQVVEE
ncbi:MAG TPA: 50S ribosomal protein L9 [Thermodesulfovibrionales bacterium]|jgi:large subunit ribosomal protein L9|nr:50S ribosomal protein L9 [Thermodesulfovibrionales bacterium]